MQIKGKGTVLLESRPFAAKDITVTLHHQTKRHKHMNTKLLILFIMLSASINASAMKYRGVVYDVGLQYNPGEYSVKTFNHDIVKYDMNVIANDLHANAVRIEGEDIARLVEASEIAHEVGLKVFFNPWWMNSEITEMVPYMAQAAEAAESLRVKGVDITFVTGCEFTLFNKGIFDGNSINERLASMMKLGEMDRSRQEEEFGKLNTKPKHCSRLNRQGCQRTLQRTDNILFRHLGTSGLDYIRHRGH